MMLQYVDLYTKNMKIKIKEVLMWYDGPYLFVGEGELKKMFLGIKVRLEGGNGYNFKRNYPF